MAYTTCGPAPKFNACIKHQRAEILFRFWLQQFSLPYIHAQFKLRVFVFRLGFVRCLFTDWTLFVCCVAAAAAALAAKARRKKREPIAIEPKSGQKPERASSVPDAHGWNFASFIRRKLVPIDSIFYGVASYLSVFILKTNLWHNRWCSFSIFIAFASNSHPHCMTMNFGAHTHTLYAPCERQQHRLESPNYDSYLFVRKTCF